MKIKYLKLENYIGVYNGTGLTKIEINFEDKKAFSNIINLFSGKNGSGKSTVMSTLHPFANTMDNKPNIILDNVDGYKEIIINFNEYDYCIKHNYILSKNGKRTVKSFIGKKRIDENKYKELNPNGTVGSFKDIVERELDVDESFFRLAKIGSDTAGFIDLLPSKRKEFLSMFLKDVDRYLESYKIISNKYSAVSKNIKFIVDQINKLEDEERLNVKLNHLSNQLSHLNKEKDKLNSTIKANEILVEELTLGKDIESEFNNGLRKLKVLKNNIDQSTTNYRKLNIYQNDIQTLLNEIIISINTNSNKINNLNDNISSIQKNINKLNNELIDINIELEKLNDVEMLDSYNIIINNYKEKLDENNKYVNELNIETDLTLDEVKTIENILNTISKFSSKIKQEFGSFEVQEVLNNEIEYNKNINILNTQYNEIKNEISVLNEELIKFNSIKDTINVLNKRPSDCINNNCLFIKNALDIKNKIPYMEEKEIKYNNLMQELKEIKDKIDNITNYNLILRRFNNFYSEVIEPNKNIIEKDKRLNIFNSLQDFIVNYNKDLTLITFEDVKYYYELTYEIEDLTNKINEVNTKITQINNISSVVDMLKNNKNKITSELTEENIKITKLKTELMDIKKLNIELETKEITIREIIALKEEIDQMSSEYNELKTYLTQIQKDANKIKEINKSNRELNQELDMVENSIPPVMQELDKVKFDIEKLKEYQERKKELEDNYEKLSILRKALSNTKGIPLLFIEVYLKKTKKIANELLEIIFNGNFFIEDFKLTEKEFLISVSKPDGEIVDDVTQASQGEKALLSIALSFALIQQSMKQYNILCLDEMDATLDTSNRRSFIDMIERQLEVMNVEQCFIISHNESFDTHNLNLLLFPGTNVEKSNTEFIKNKNVIIDLS